MSVMSHKPMLSRGLLLLAVGAMLAGCGVRGPLQTPKPEASPGSPSAAPQPEATANAESGQGKPANAAAKPHQGFILDGLLR